MEQYKEIPGFIGYFADSEGNVYSNWTVHGLKAGRYRKLHPAKWRNGYSFLNLRIAPYTYYATGVHRLVCLAFLGLPPTAKHTASHLDGNKDNNRLENLIWETLLDNQKRKVGHGHYDGGFLNSRAKINKETLDKIRELLGKKKLTHKQIGELFGVSRVFVTKIKNGNRYKNV